MTLFPVLVDVYHNEQLVTNKEAKEASSHTWNWGEVAVVKDVSTASKIADILNKYGCNAVAQHIKGKFVYKCNDLLYSAGVSDCVCMLR